MTINRNNFEREHTNFRLHERGSNRRSYQEYNIEATYNNFGQFIVSFGDDDVPDAQPSPVPERNLDRCEVRLTVNYPYGMKSCFANPETTASQFKLHIAYREEVSTLFRNELESFMPPSVYLDLAHRYMTLEAYDFGFKFSDGNGSTYDANSRRSMSSYNQLMFDTNFPWLVRSYAKRDSDPRHRAFWNRLEYKIELLAISFKARLKQIKKYIKEARPEGSTEMIFDKNVHLREGYRASNYEPIKNMLSDDYLRVMNIPPHERTELEGYFPDRKALRKLKVIAPFKEFDASFQESLDTLDTGLDEQEDNPSASLGVCWITGHTGLCKKIRFYGRLVKVNKEFIEANNLPFTWLSCAESYIYTYDPRLLIGKLRITDENKRKLNLELLPESVGRKGIRSIQHGYLEEKGFEYCNGSEDWCDQAVTLFNDEQQRKYSFSHARNNFGLNDRPIYDSDGIMTGHENVWFDGNDPCVSRAGNMFAEDDRERLGNQVGRICSIPFGDRPERFYGYMREDNKGELETTKYAKPRERYYGIEIELERRSRSTDAFIMLTQIIPELKKIGFVSGTDGSLGEGGTEFRSCPQTFPVLQKNLERFYEVVSPYFKVKDTCGVHIHVSRSSLSNYQIGKIIGFVYNPNNGAFIRDVAGRDSGRWQEFESGSTFNLQDSSSASPRIRLNKRKLQSAGSKMVEKRTKNLRHYEFSNGGKYTAVNTGLSATIEFRLFKGSGNYDLCMRYLEFVDGLCKYTETGKVDAPIRQLVRGSVFTNWLMGHGKKYPNLCKFLAIKNNKSSDTSGFSFKKWKARAVKKGKLSATS